ncbi:MAG: hypothetical protein DI546_01315 [Rhizobium sp.]|nr:MAG: hypothetical protein DI546_01315 [Rhizobium sp.]
MPRIARPENETGRRRTERYRAAEARKGVEGTKGRPEASHVDRALAAAVAVSCSLADPSPEMQGIVRLAKDILKLEGFDGRESLRKIQSRVLYRRDLPELLEIPRSFPSPAPGGASL